MNSRSVYSFVNQLIFKLHYPDMLLDSKKFEKNKRKTDSY